MPRGAAPASTTPASIESASATSTPSTTVRRPPGTRPLIVRRTPLLPCTATPPPPHRVLLGVAPEIKDPARLRVAFSLPQRAEESRQARPRRLGGGRLLQIEATRRAGDAGRRELVVDGRRVGLGLAHGTHEVADGDVV